MPQLDLLADLRAGRSPAPSGLRERVRAIAAAAAPPPRRLTWRRAALVLVPAVLAVAVGAAVMGRNGNRVAENATVTSMTRELAPSGVAAGQPGAVQPAASTLDKAIAPPPSQSRPQDYDATLRLRVPDATALSNATKRAVRIAGSLGGFASVIDVNVDGKHGSALLRLRVPVIKVQAAIERLSELGTITGESVQVQDLKPSLDALDGRIARLQRQLRALRANTATRPARIAALTAQIERLQRSRGGTIRQARLATISVELFTPAPALPKPDEKGPLDGAVSALKWLAIGALYGLIVGGPVVALLAAAWLGWRAYRRRAEQRLLERV